MTRLFNFNRFYDWLAPFYAGWQAALPMWRRYTEAVLPWLPQGQILEIGPGPGVLLAQLAATQPLAVGLDRSSGMLRQAKKRLVRKGLPVRLVRGEATHLPFANDSMNAVVLTFTLSAIPDGLGAMQEIARLLCRPRPDQGLAGGLVALVDAGYPSDGNPAGVALVKLWELGGDLIRDEAALMNAAGLKVIHRREFGAFDSIRLVVGQRYG
jgi:SAM-dependent methyltransferase